MNFEIKTKKKRIKNKKTGKKPRVLFSIRFKMAFLVLIAITLTMALSLGLALVAHMVVAVEQIVDGNRMLGRTLAVAIDQDISTQLFERTAEIYYSIPEDEKADPMSGEYLAKYSELMDDSYYEMLQEMRIIAEECDLKWIDLRLVDIENDRFIYIMDTEERDDDRYDLGVWRYRTDEVATFERSEELKDSEEDWVGKGAWKTFGNDQKWTGGVYCTIAPFYHPETGEVIGYIGLGEELGTIVSDLGTYFKVFEAFMFFLVVSVLLITSLFTGMFITKPIKRLTNAAKNYVSNHDSPESEPVFAKVKIKSHDEIRVLADSMKDMELDLASYIENVTALTAKQERIDAELGVAETIQTSMLPEELIGYNGPHCFDVSSYMKPAKEVGGDFYDYFVIDDDHIGLSIADVSGKGVPAALFMAISKTLLKNATQEYGSPAKVVDKVNHQLCENNPEMMFVTVWFGIYTISTGQLIYVNAGHERPAVYRAQTGRYELVVEDHDVVLGFEPELTFRERTITLGDGDKLFLYTDGIPEATSSSGGLFGDERLIASLNRTTGVSREEVFKMIVSDIDTFVNGAEQFDDMTMLLFERV